MVARNAPLLRTVGVWLAVVALVAMAVSVARSAVYRSPARANHADTSRVRRGVQIPLPPPTARATELPDAEEKTQDSSPADAGPSPSLRLGQLPHGTTGARQQQARPTAQRAVPVQTTSASATATAKAKGGAKAADAASKGATLATTAATPRVPQWDGAVSVGPPSLSRNRVQALLTSCRGVIRPPRWRAAYIVASRPYVAAYQKLAKAHGGGMWSVLVEEELVPDFGNRSLKDLRPRRGWDRQQDVKLAFLASPGAPNTVIFDGDSLCSCGQSWERFAAAAATKPKIDLCVEAWNFEPARSNMVATARVLGVPEVPARAEGAARGLIGWTPQVMSRDMFRLIIRKHRPTLLRDLLKARRGPVCKGFARLPQGNRLRGRCWTEYFVYQLLGQRYGYWNKYHDVIVGNVEDGRYERINTRCAHVRIKSRGTLVKALTGAITVPPFLMLDDHAEAFSAEAVLALVSNVTLAGKCRAPPTKTES